MSRAFVAVGSNLGDRLNNLREAQLFLGKVPGVKILKASPVYETDPVGGAAFQEKYLNAVWEVETLLTARQLLEVLLQIEKSLGRERSIRNAPRTLDLDILFYDQKVIEEEGLTVPHPRLHERSFVLKPLADLAPDWMHPKLNKPVRALLENLSESHPKS